MKYSNEQKTAAIILSHYMSVFWASQLLHINQYTVGKWYADAKKCHECKCCNCCNNCIFNPIK